ncbi:hypothetical protein V6N12_049250 [Hibiscus sabdariffa]|uniref:Uncharacterized protein n=1 Tax=Hibiscus sabdariffa TaxID=183260 RepID=A0ABR2EL52_9ROSI
MIGSGSFTDQGVREFLVLQLRIVLKQEMKVYVIEQPVPNDPGANAPRADKDKFKKHMDDMLDVGCLVLATMTPKASEAT